MKILSADNLPRNSRPYDEVVRSAVMRDFGDTNKLVIDMWANFKATEIQTWMIVFLSLNSF